MLEIYVKDGCCYELKPEESAKTFDVPVVLKVTMEKLEDIVVTMFESGCSNGWLALDNTGSDWDKEPKDLPTSQYLFSLLIAGKSVKFMDAEGEEDDSNWILTLDKLLAGIALDFKNYQTDLDNLDGEDADRIMQYALFGDIVYG